MTPRALLVGGLLGLAACSTSTPDCGSPENISGTWNYSGAQTGPTATLTGTLTLTRTGSCSVTGTLLLTVNTGTPETTNWQATGTFLDDSILELNADSAGGAERHHLGTVRADTIAGNWNMTAGGASGTFKAVRSTP